MTLNLTFLVVEASSAYNAILGRGALNKLGAIVSTPHLMMKFLTPNGIGCEQGDQELARSCYSVAVRRGVARGTSGPGDSSHRERDVIHGAVEATKQLILREDKSLKIGTQLPTAEKVALCEPSFTYLVR
jgi:hypothetical protein